MNNKTFINKYNKVETTPREIVKNLLGQCTENQQRMFKLMYARDNGRRSVEDAENMNINDVVDQMNISRINIAIGQCERTVLKNKSNGL